MSQNKKLIQLIQECISEVLNEATGSVSISNKNPKSQDPNYLKRYTQQGLNVSISETEQTELDEMARIASKYKLADDYDVKLAGMDAKVRNNSWVQGIIEYVKEVGEASVGQTAKEKFDRPQQSIFMLWTKVLVPQGILVPTEGEAVAKHDKFVAAKADAEEKGEEFDEEDALYQGWNQSKKLSDYINYSHGSGVDAEEMFVGPYFDDNIGSQLDADGNETNHDTLVGTGDYNDDAVKGVRQNSQYHRSSNQNKDARMAAADFFSDDENTSLLNKIVAAAQTARSRPKASVRESFEDKMISNKDFYGAEKARVASSKEGVEGLIQQYVDKIRTQTPEVQQAIIDMLHIKLPGHSSQLIKKIETALGKIQQVDNKPAFADEDEDFDDTEGEAVDGAYDPTADDDEVTEGEEMLLDDEAEIDESFITRMQELAGLK